MKHIYFLIVIILLQSCSYIIPEYKVYSNDAKVHMNSFVYSTDYTKNNKCILEIWYQKNGYLMSSQIVSDKKVANFKKYDVVPIYRTWKGKMFIINENNERLYFTEREHIIEYTNENIFEDTVTN